MTTLFKITKDSQTLYFEEGTDTYHIWCWLPDRTPLNASVHVPKHLLPLSIPNIKIAAALYFFAHCLETTAEKIYKQCSVFEDRIFTDDIIDVIRSEIETNLELVDYLTGKIQPKTPKGKVNKETRRDKMERTVFTELFTDLQNSAVIGATTAASSVAAEDLVAITKKVLGSRYPTTLTKFLPFGKKAEPLLVATLLNLACKLWGQHLPASDFLAKVSKLAMNAQMYELSKPLVEDLTKIATQISERFKANDGNTTD